MYSPCHAVKSRIRPGNDLRQYQTGNEVWQIAETGYGYLPLSRALPTSRSQEGHQDLVTDPMGKRAQGRPASADVLFLGAPSLLPHPLAFAHHGSAHLRMLLWQ